MLSRSKYSLKATVPPENTYSFTEVLPRPIRRLTPRSRLCKDAACRNFTEVLDRFTEVYCGIQYRGKRQDAVEFNRLTYLLFRFINFTIPSFTLR